MRLALCGGDGGVMNKICFLFGHADCPDSIMPQLEQAIEDYYSKHGVTDFYVGSRGRFDSLAATAVKRIKQQYTDIKLYQLLAYHPAERPVDLWNGFDGSYYPPLENTPRQYTIVKANQHMVMAADMIICYVWHHGNTRTLLEMAHRRKVPTINLANEKVEQY